nr:hypothetical protein [Tanacetum cinerariifolium]
MIQHHGLLPLLLMREEVEINKLKERVKLLEDRKGVAATRSRNDAPIKGRSMDEGEAATDRISDDSEEMATVLTSMDAATVLASGVVNVPTGSRSIPTASTPAEEQVPTGSDVVPTASSLVFATTTMVTPYSRRNGKEVMKSEYNIDFHHMVDFIEASPLRRNLKLKDEEGISSLPDTKLFENLKLIGYNISPNQKFTFQKGQFSHQWKRTRIAQSSVPPTIADEPASPLRDVSQGEAFPTDSGFITDQDRATIDNSSTLPHDSAPRVTSPAAIEGSMQQTILELTALCTSLQRQLSELTAKFQAQEVEIYRLNKRVKLLEDRKGVAATRSRNDAPIKGRSMDEGEAATDRISDDSEEMATVLTSMDAATVLASGVVNVPTGSRSIPTASTPAEEQVPTGRDVVAKELEEQLERKDQRRSEQIARDAKIARIHAEEELQIMIDVLDINNETVAKYLQEYHQFALELPMERRIELISDLVKYQDNYAKIYKFQSQQRKPWTKKQKRDYYMAVIRSNLGWKVKDFRGMTFEEVEAKFNSVWKQLEDFIPIGSKEEAERIKRKVELKFYDSCGVHHVTSKDKEIFMLVEKDYPLRKGLALVMISYKLQVENYSQMANDLILKIYKIANSPRQQGD